MIRTLQNYPYWSFPGATVDVDFKNRRVFGTTVGLMQTFSGTTPYQGSMLNSDSAFQAVYLPNSLGVLVLQPSAGLRITTGMGVWAHAVGTQSCLWNRDLTNAVWVAVNSTAVKNQIGADGVANVASSITATAILGTILQTITATSSIRSFEVYIKRLVGSGTLEMTMDGVTWTAVVPTTSYARYNIPNQTLANPVVGFRIGTNGDSFAIDFCHCNNSANGNPAVVSNTSAAGSMFNEEPGINSVAGTHVCDGLRIIKNVFGGRGAWSGYTEYFGTPVGFGTGVGTPFATDGNWFVQGGSNGGPASFIISSNPVTSPNNGNVGFGNWNRVAWTATGGGSKVCLNGGVVAFASNVISAPNPTQTHAGIGNNGSGSTVLNGVTSRIAFWNRELPNSTLQNMTALPA